MQKDVSLVPLLQNATNANLAGSIVTKDDAIVVTGIVGLVLGEVTTVHLATQDIISSYLTNGVMHVPKNASPAPMKLIARAATKATF